MPISLSLFFFFLCQSLYKSELQPLVAHMRIRKSRQQKHDLKLPERPTRSILLPNLQSLLLIYENLEMIFLQCINIVNKQVKENKKNHSFPSLLKDPTNKANEK